MEQRFRIPFPFYTYTFDLFYPIIFYPSRPHVNPSTVKCTVFTTSAYSLLQCDSIVSTYLPAIIKLLASMPAEEVCKVCSLRLRRYAAAFVCCVILLCSFAAFVCCVILLRSFAAFFSCVLFLRSFAAFFCCVSLLRYYVQYHIQIVVISCCLLVCTRTSSCLIESGNSPVYWKLSEILDFVL